MEDIYNSAGNYY